MSLTTGHGPVGQDRRWWASLAVSALTLLVGAGILVLPDRCRRRS